MPKPYYCTTSFVTRFPCPQKFWNPPRKLCPKCLNFCAKSVQMYRLVQTVWIHTVRPPTIEKYFGPKMHINCFLENRALFLWKMCPLCCSVSSLKHTQKISLNLIPMCSQHSTCLAHYPMHSFINLKMTLSLQSVLFTFPNPKSKGQD